MSSVLLSFSLSMFAVAQGLRSLIHDCMELSSSDILSGGADICNCKSSANELYMIECESRIWHLAVVTRLERVEDDSDYTKNVQRYWKGAVRDS